MSPGDPLYFTASLLMLGLIAAVGGVPAWLMLSRAAPPVGLLLALLWLVLPLGAFAAGAADPHDFIRYFVLPPFVAGWAIAALLCALAKLRKRAHNP